MDIREIIRDLKFINRLFVFKHFEIRNFLDGGYTVLINSFNGEANIFQKGKADRMTVEQEEGAHNDFGIESFEKRFPIRVNPRGHTVIFRKMNK